MSNLPKQGFLLEFILDRDSIRSSDEYPFNLPAFNDLGNLRLHPQVTFLIGENGSGKSTFLETIAQLLDINPEGGNKNTYYSDIDTNSEIFKCMRLVRSSRRPNDYYFLRAESFYKLASYIDSPEMSEFLWTYGGKKIHEQSHGEGFMATLTNKLRGGGIYLFDEPEAALSPSRQLAALAIFHQLVGLESQLVIATHSPILMAYPNALIYEFSDSGIHETLYKETEHYTITREFLNKPEKMLQYLFEEESVDE